MNDLLTPNLENRFLPPDNWQEEYFVNPETGHSVRYQFLLPATAPRAIVIALPGLSEYGEKYIETARFFLDRQIGFYVIDWAYQGKSTRLKENPHKRHSDGYESDISDLHFLITNKINVTSPLFMLGHSMGGNIGLRYLIQYPETFKVAAFSAPMLGIYDLRHFYSPVKWLLHVLKPLYKHYIPGGKDWHESARSSDGNDIFSSDPVRDQVHNAWCLANTSLQVGNPTFKWLYESLKSINILKQTKAIKTSTLFAYAGNEKLVDNDAIIKLSQNLENSKLLSLPDSNHEILMERDSIRDKFLEETLQIFSL